MRQEDRDEDDWFRITDRRWTAHNLEVEWSCERGAEIKEISYLIVGEVEDKIAYVSTTGKSDERETILAALRDVAENGGHVHFSAGVYPISKQILIRPAKDFIVNGDGAIF